MSRSVATLTALLIAVACSSPADPPLVDETPDIRLEQVVRIGTVEGPEVEQFTGIGGLQVDPETGEVFVLDSGSRDIRVFDRGGSFLRRFGGAGEGPGEFGSDPVMVVARDTLVAFDGAHRVHLFTRGGDHLATTMVETVSGYVIPIEAFADSLGWVVKYMEFPVGASGVATSERYYRLHLPDMALGDPFLEIVPGSQAERGILDERVWVTHTGEGFLTTSGPGYSLTWTPIDGSPTRTLTFPVAAVPVPATAFEEYAEARRESCMELNDPARCLQSLDQRLDVKRALPIPEYRPVLGGVYGSRVGVALVLRADLDPDPFRGWGSRHHDLITVEGERLGSVELPERFAPRWLDRDEVWGIWTDDLDVPHVVGYRMAGAR